MLLATWATLLTLFSFYLAFKPTSPFDKNPEVIALLRLITIALSMLLSFCMLSSLFGTYSEFAFMTRQEPLYLAIFSNIILHIVAGILWIVSPFWLAVHKASLFNTWHKWAHVN
jgi:hypothetical protein